MSATNVSSDQTQSASSRSGSKQDADTSKQDTGSSRGSAHLQFDIGYLKSLAGIIKLVEAVLSLIAFICVQSIRMVTYLSAAGFYKFVSLAGFWIALLLTLLYVFHVVEIFKRLPWLISEAVLSAVWCVFFFCAACVAASKGEIPGWAAAAFFGFAAMIVFGYEAYRKYASWKENEPAQGEAQISNPNLEPTGSNAPNFSQYTI